VWNASEPEAKGRQRERKAASDRFLHAWFWVLSSIPRGSVVNCRGLHTMNSDGTLTLVLPALPFPYRSSKVTGDVCGVNHQILMRRDFPGSAKGEKGEGGNKPFRPPLTATARGVVWAKVRSSLRGYCIVSCRLPRRSKTGSVLSGSGQRQQLQEKTREKLRVGGKKSGCYPTRRPGWRRTTDELRFVLQPFIDLRCGSWTSSVWSSAAWRGSEKYDRGAASVPP